MPLTGVDPRPVMLGLNEGWPKSTVLKKKLWGTHQYRDEHTSKALPTFGRMSIGLGYTKAALALMAGSVKDIRVSADKRVGLMDIQSLVSAGTRSPHSWAAVDDGYQLGGFKHENGNYHAGVLRLVHLLMVEREYPGISSPAMSELMERWLNLLHYANSVVPLPGPVGWLPSDIPVMLSNPTFLDYALSVGNTLQQLSYLHERTLKTMPLMCHEPLASIVDSSHTYASSIFFEQVWATRPTTAPAMTPVSSTPRVAPVEAEADLADEMIRSLDGRVLPRATGDDADPHDAAFPTKGEGDSDEDEAEERDELAELGRLLEEQIADTVQRALDPDNADRDQYEKAVAPMRKNVAPILEAAANGDYAEVDDLVRAASNHYTEEEEDAIRAQAIKAVNQVQRKAAEAMGESQSKAADPDAEYEPEDPEVAAEHAEEAVDQELKRIENDEVEAGRPLIAARVQKAKEQVKQAIEEGNLDKVEVAVADRSTFTAEEAQAVRNLAAKAIDKARKAKAEADAEMLEETAPTEEEVKGATKLLGDHLIRIDRTLGWASRIMLVGPTGTGKTSHAIYSAIKRGYSIEMVTLHPGLDAKELFGGYARSATSEGEGTWAFVPGPLVRWAQQAQTSPNRVMLIIDELARGHSSVIAAIMSLLNPYNGTDILQQGLTIPAGWAVTDDFHIVEVPMTKERIVVPARNIVIVGTSNLGDKYLGMKLDDPAFMRRWDSWQFMGNYPAAVTGDILADRLGVPSNHETIQAMLRVAEQVDTIQVETQRLTTTLSLPLLLTWGKAYKSMLEQTKGMKRSTALYEAARDTWVESMVPMVGSSLDGELLKKLQSAILDAAGKLRD